MCTIFLAWHYQPEKPLVLLGNRDEFHHRPTAAARRLTDSDVVGGQDLRAGGMWFGINKATGRFAAITNIRNRQAKKGSVSRGHIVRGFLHNGDTLESFNIKIMEDKETHSGYNLLYGDLEQAWHFNNQNGQPPRQLEPGIYGVSNADLDSPWPKVLRGKQQFQQLLEQNASCGALIGMMQNTQKAAKQSLPNTGLSTYLEHLLSPLFIRSPLYGTRCTSLVMAKGGSIELYEQRYQRNGEKKAPVSGF